MSRDQRSLYKMPRGIRSGGLAWSLLLYHLVYQLLTNPNVRGIDSGWCSVLSDFIPMAFFSRTWIGDRIKPQIDRPWRHIELVVYCRGAATLLIEVLRAMHYNIMVSLLLFLLRLNIDHDLTIIYILFVYIVLLSPSIVITAGRGRLLVQRGPSLGALPGKDHLFDLWFSALVSFIIKLWAESALSQHLLFLKLSGDANVLLVNLSLFDQ